MDQPNFYSCRCRLVVLLILLFISSVTFAQTDTTYISGGIISTDSTWDKGNSPYVISGDVIVEDGAKLTIEPGVKVFFEKGDNTVSENNPYKMIINGQLFCVGTESDSIYFDDIDGFKDENSWRLINLTNNTYSKINYSNFSNSNDGAVILFDIDSVIVENSTFNNCFIGLKFEDYNTPNMDKYTRIENNYFINNDYGIFYVADFKDLKVQNNTFQLNDDDVSVQWYESSGGELICNYNNFLTAAVSNESKDNVDFQFNYWGQITTTEMESGGNPKNISAITDYYDDSNRGVIDYSHWLDAPWPDGEPVGDTYTAKLLVTDKNYQEEMLTYHSGDSIFIQITDTDRNADDIVSEQITMDVWSETETNYEVATLMETDVATGIFRGYLPIDDISGSAVADGKLQIAHGEWMYFEYIDPEDDWGNSTTLQDSIVFNATISIAQEITGSWIFRKIDSPYIVTGQHSIMDGNLIIEPGVQVYVMGADFVNMNFERASGSFQAVGTQTDSIYIEFIIKEYPDFSGFLFYHNVDLQYCNIKNAPAISLFEGNSLKNSKVFNTIYSISCNRDDYYNTKLIEIDSNDFEQVVFVINQGSNVNVMYNNFTSHAVNDYAFISQNHLNQEGRIQYNNFFIDPSNFLNRGSDIDAQFNYWGIDATTEMNEGNNPKDISVIWDYYNDNNLGKVNYSHWLDAPWPDGISTSGGFTASIKIFDTLGNELSGYFSENEISIELKDNDGNADSVKIDSLFVHLNSLLEPSGLDLVLVETDIATGSFIGSVTIDAESGFPINDQLLQMDYYNELNISYIDSLNDWGNLVILNKSMKYKIKPPAEYTADENTLLLLHLNEGSGQIAFDSSDGLNHATLGNTDEIESTDPSWSEDGAINGCIFTHADDHLVIPHTEELNLTNNTTFECFFKFENLVPGHIFNIVKKHGNFGITVDENRNGAFIIYSTETDETHYSFNIDEIVINRWYHVAASILNDQLNIYVDDVKVASHTDLATFNLSSNPIIIPYNLDWLNMTGYIDEIRFSNIARNSFIEYESISPGEIDDLTIVDSSYYTISLRWHAPGADRYTGTCELYDLRMSTSFIDSANFYEADSITGFHSPLIAGSLETFTVEDLNSGTTYYFALKAMDDEGNWSPISNIAVGSTPPRYVTDDRDGQEYKIQKIGYQTWFAENINFYTSDGSWYYLDDSLTYADTLGRLYDWATALTADTIYNSSNLNPSYPVQGVCPAGWHIPSDCDWMVLEDTLGMEENSLELTGWRGSNQGDLLKYDSLSGFDAIPAGYRLDNGTYDKLDAVYNFWTASEFDANQGWYRGLDTARSDIYRGEISKAYALPVRCVEDIAPLTISLVKTDISKVNGSDGQIEATISGGIQPYSIVWSNGSDLEHLADLVAGRYIINVTDARDSIAADSIVVYETYTDVRDNQVYTVIHIDDRVWLAENLDYATPDDSYYYNNDSVSNASQYGRLYTWEAASTACPQNWYVPSDTEWQDLEYALGMAASDTSLTGFRGTDQGNQLKEGGTSGFEASYGGNYDQVNYAGLGTEVWFWTCTSIDSTAWYRHLLDGNPGIDRDTSEIIAAYSVRCIADTCALIDLSFETENVSCFGESNGSVNLTVTGGKEPYSYQWSQADTTEDLSGIPAGIFYITITDSVGCVKIDSITIEQPALLTAIITDSTNITCNGDTDGSALITASGGTQPYQYSWDDMANTKDSAVHDLIANQYYRVIVEDANGCIAGDSVILAEPDAPDLGLLSQYELLCSGEAIDITATEGYAAYQWSNGDTTNQVTINESGNYQLNIIDQSGCPGYAEFNVSVDSIYNKQDICVVTVDPATEKNQITWAKSPDELIESYNIYRETGNNVYTEIGTVQYDAENYFVDEGSNPKSTSERYKISITDPCGNESELSFAHKTIYLQASLGLNNTVNLQWTNYEGFDYSQVNVLRGVSYETLNVLATRPSNNTTFTDVDPDPSETLYVIEAIAGYSCDTTSGGRISEEYAYTRSNIGRLESTTGTEEQLFSQVRMYPNPTTGMFRLEVPEDLGKYTLDVVSMNGNIVYHNEDVVKDQDIDLSSLPDGVYILYIMDFRLSIKVYKN